MIGLTFCDHSKNLLKPINKAATKIWNDAKNTFQIKLNINRGYCGENESTLIQPKTISICVNT